MEYDAMCPFCIELKKPELSIWNNKRKILPLNRIIFENEHWVVMPPLGSFQKGGLLIVSKEHFRACSNCREDVLDSLNQIIIEVRCVLSRKYKKEVLFFEHGPSLCGSKGACCVDHAHLNVFPIDFDIWEELPDFPDEIKINQIFDIKRLRGLDKEYIWLIDSTHNSAYPVSGVPSQYIRSVITRHYGYPDRWNWQEYLGLDEIKKTMEDLSHEWTSKGR